MGWVKWAQTKLAPVEPAPGETARVELAGLKKPGLSGPWNRWARVECALDEHKLSCPRLF